MSRFFAQNSIDPESLNAFQDDYIAAEFERWRTFSSNRLYVTNNASGIMSLQQIMPNTHLSLEANAAPVKRVRGLVWDPQYIPVGHASAGRTRRMRIRMTVIMGTSNANFMTGLGLYSIAANGTNVANVTTTVVSGSLAGFPALGQNRTFTVESAEFTAPAAGIYMYGVTRPSVAAVQSADIIADLQYRVA